ncbi:MAG: phosphate-starvation-inducible PsiE family protein [Arcobacteraceae bacterium]|nr:phosphate-starvation-inducible PsiE family protein [Arcobacteraceae bacterium]
MITLEKFFHNKFYIEIIVASVLFIVAISTNSMIEIIINLLYFIIMLEIVRAVVGFLREQKIELKFLIDAFIVLTLREFIVNVVKINKEEFHSFNDLFSSSVNFHIMIFSGVLLFLFILRWLSIYITSKKVIKC